MCFCFTFSNSYEKGLLTFLLTILIYVCSCGLEHMMVTLPLNATNRQWFHYMTQKIFHVRFLSFLLLQLPIMMVFLALPLHALLFFLFVLLVCHGLHHILQ